MAQPATLRRLHQWIWVFIYGGLLTLVIGLSLPSGAPALASGLQWGGGSLALLGVALIGMRSVPREDPEA